MPTYDYRCSECGHAFEEFQSMNAEPLVVCPKCSKSALKRGLGGGVGMIFKGSGFYLTDYKKGSAEKKDGKPATPSTTESSTSEKKPSSAEKKSES